MTALPDLEARVPCGNMDYIHNRFRDVIVDRIPILIVDIESAKPGLFNQLSKNSIRFVGNSYSGSTELVVFVKPLR